MRTRSAESSTASTVRGLCSSRLSTFSDSQAADCADYADLLCVIRAIRGFHYFAGGGRHRNRPRILPLISSLKLSPVDTDTKTVMFTRVFTLANLPEWPLS